MALTLFRSHRIEALVQQLDRRLAGRRPQGPGGAGRLDPFRRIPICVGSRGMARWLEHELATLWGVAAAMEFPFPRAALGGAARWVLEGSGPEGPLAVDAPFWDEAFWRGWEARRVGDAGEGAPTLTDEDWAPDALALRLLSVLRRRLAAGSVDGARGEDLFEAPRRYLALGAAGSAGGGGEAGEGREDDGVSRRELLFARAVADVLDTLSHQAPRMALAWAREPLSAKVVPGSSGQGGRRAWGGVQLGSGDYRWLATLAADLGVGEAPSSPAVRFEALERVGPRVHGPRPWLGVFGLSTLGPGERALLEILGRHMDVDLFLLSPSPTYWAEMVERARATDADAEERALRDNPILASLGRASAEIVRWVAERDVQDTEVGGEAGGGSEAERDSLLAAIQGWIYRADGVGTAGVGGPASLDPPESLAGVRERAGELLAQGSLRFHSTYGPLRQCEVLRDELLRRFAADPSLDPREVLVMTPQVDVFAPLLAAVFARKGLAVRRTVPDQAAGTGGGEAGGGSQELTAVPPLQAAISDLGLRQTNPVAEVLLAALELAGERVTAPRLAALLGLDPVRRRLGLDEDDVAAMVEALVASNTRWGLDAADRARHGQPARDANTVRFGAERVALGALMHDPGGLGSLRPPELGTDGDLRLLGLEAGVSGEGGGPLDGSLVRGVVPLAVAGAEGREGELRAGALAVLARRLAWVRELLAGPHTVAGWVERLRAVMDGLAETSEAATWLKLQVNDELERFERAAAVAAQKSPDAELTLRREAMLAWLEGRFDNPVRGGDRAVTGAISVSGLEPMRAVPFRVVALLGMDDGVFPRDPVRPAWDPLHGAPGGPLPRRDVDRHLLLEALLSARDALWIFWTGRDARHNDERPAAVPIEELLETLGRVTGLGRAALVTEHPLQPWSPRAYRALRADPGEGEGGGVPSAAPGVAGPEPALDAPWAWAAEHLSAVALGEATPVVRGLGGAGLGPHGPEPLAPERTPPREIDIQGLASALYRAPRAFMERRLKLRRDEERAWPSAFDPLGFPDIGERDGDWVEAALREMLADQSLLDAAASAHERIFVWENRLEAEADEDDGGAPGEAGRELADVEASEVPADVEEAQAVWGRWLRRHAGRLYRRLEAEGRTPPRSIGVHAVDVIVAKAAALALAVRRLLLEEGPLCAEPVTLSALVEGPAGSAVDITHVLGEWPRVLCVPEPTDGGSEPSGEAEDDFPLGPGRWLLDVSAFPVNDWARLRAWIGLLAARASGHADVQGAVLLGTKGTVEVLHAPDPAAAARSLADLVAVWRAGRRWPLPLFKKTSPNIAQALATRAAIGRDGRPALLNDKARGGFVSAVRRGWEGKPHNHPPTPGDRDEAENKLLFAGYHPLEEIERLGLEAPVVRWAVRVWGGILGMDPRLRAALLGVDQGGSEEAGA